MEEKPSHAATHLTPDPLEASQTRARRGEGRAGKAARALALDLTPLRESRDFRLLFAGQAVSFFGSMMTFVAVPWQVYRLTGSSFAVGMLGVAEFALVFVMAFVGGALADAVDRRRMVRVTEALIAALTAVLIFNSLLARPRVWVIFSATALFAALNALQRPSLDALVPRLVKPERMPAALALRFLSTTTG
ncbi:MAG: MFS transporter, partial [Acidobacteriota bacterium]|nr:MFS transporter [Acidobacteriota bacterium]